jgi:pseudaminic acid biosynthesis-associated methylase
MSTSEPATSAAPTPQLALWQSTFGASYTDRNDVEKPERIATWRKILAGLDVRRAVEVGCNVGWNLRYLSQAGVPAVWGVEPQTYAIERARRADPTLTIVPGTAFSLPFRDGCFDLAFTSGVLIHISPDDLGRALDELYRVTSRYLIVIEYDHPAEVEVSYRGHEGALWKRDHGAVIAARFPTLTKLASGFLGPDVGYDDCTYHVFERTDRS